MTRRIGGAGTGPSPLSRSAGTPPPPPKAAQKNTAATEPSDLREARYESRFEEADTARPKPQAEGAKAGATAGARAGAGASQDTTKLGADVRKTLDEQLALHPKNSAACKTLNALAASPGFQGMKPADQQKLLRYVGGTNRDLSGPARAALDKKLGTDAYKKADAGKQTAQLQKFLTDQPATPDVVSPQKDAFKDKRLPYTLHGPTKAKDIEFQSGKADAVKYEVEVDGRKIPVYLPKKMDKTSTHSIDEVAKGLAALPKSSRALVKEVLVEGKPNPDDAYWAKEYNDPNFSSYMTAGADGVINVYPSKPKQSQDYLDGTMIHETGHTLSMKTWGSDDSDKRWDGWKAAVKSDGIVPSKYAKASVGEDFGETLQLYQQVKGTSQEAEVRAMMPERFKIIDSLIAGKP
ncbi:hypothetical protein D7W79_40625 [Corallococcus exercitus]|uniref:hypothetical protein n=1 Tax=Corallococcus exercitus TaxID=2316736 RepID=UPI000EA30371|nr:hypothetical protein [Corallococcus exercitus]RKG63094.1 hypothetical protein D7W79_40625 [Corallococcus exercitus]